MEDNQTICYKIDVCTKEIEKMIKTKEVNLSLLSQNLHQIRLDAQRMEFGLRRRKALMKKHEIEDEYQKFKTTKETPKGINEGPQEGEALEESTKYFQVLVKSDKRILYHNKEIRSGVLSIVEEIEDIDPNGQMYGTTQRFVFGEPLEMVFAFDQLRQAIEAESAEVMASLFKIMGKRGYSREEIINKLKKRRG